jgi:hypothetical protein
MVYFKFLSHSPNNTVDKLSSLVTIKILGQRNLVITYSNKKCVIASSLQYVIGVSFAHFVGYYVTVMIYLSLDLFVGGLIVPTKSISHLSNTCNITCGLRGISSLLLGLPTL